MVAAEAAELKRLKENYEKAQQDVEAAEKQQIDANLG